MRESSFIDQNKQKWKTYETLLSRPEIDPEALHQAFVEITDDLSYARTFYPNRSVRYYLNNLAQRIFYQLSNTRPFNLSDLVQFWTRQLPTLVFTYRRTLMISLLVFMLALLIGAFSAHHDPAFVESILGSDYVQMTRENIAKGDPMAVYKSMNSTDMFFGITLNNISVSIRTFLMGLLAGFGSLAILFYNGIMVGCFQYFFVQNELFVDSFLAIWLHGTIEISCIIIAGGAGLVVGQHLLFPGTYRRFQSFKIGGTRGLQLLMGILPLIGFAAFIEGFFTRHTGVPDVLRLLFILLCLSFVLGYFVWYPYQLHRRGKMTKLREDITPLFHPDIELHQIKTPDRLIGDALIAGRQSLGTYIKAQWPVWLTLGLAVGVMYYLQGESPYPDVLLVHLLGEIMAPSAASTWYVHLITGLLWWLNLTVPLLPQFKVCHKRTNALWIATGLFILGWWGFSYASNILGILMLILMSSYYYFMLTIWSEEKTTWMQVMIRAKQLLSPNAGAFAGAFLPLFLMEITVFFLSYFTIAKGVQMMISWNIGMSDVISKALISIFIAFLSSIFMGIHYHLCRMMYWSFRERNEATGIEKKVQMLFHNE